METLNFELSSLIFTLCAMLYAETNARIMKFQISRLLRTNQRKAGILVGCKVGQSVGLLGDQIYFSFSRYEYMKECPS